MPALTGQKFGEMSLARRSTCEENPNPADETASTEYHDTARQRSLDVDAVGPQKHHFQMMPRIIFTGAEVPINVMCASCA